MSVYDRDTLLKDLMENVAEVYFTKVDGTARRMKCTLLPHLLPPNTDLNYLKEEHKKEENLSVIACWDLENMGWRSFRIDSVNMVQLLDQHQY